MDERFCTRDYFLLLTRAAGIDVTTPAKSYLGAKKTPPDTSRLLEWVDKTVRSGDCLVLSLDMLCHGGLIPSRMSLDTLETLRERLGLLRKLKARSVEIYATTTITRTPFYNSAEEEPDYWQYYGQDVYDLSRLIARSYRGERVAPQILEKLNGLPTVFVRDYLVRRRRNFQFVSLVIDMVREGTLDFLNLVLDDNSQESLSFAEGEIHRSKVKALKLDERISIHAGADEATLSLLSKLLTDHFEFTPVFEVAYASPEYKSVVPPYEGVPLEVGIESHIEASGGKFAQSGGQILLLVNNNDSRVGLDSPLQPKTPRDSAPYERFFNRLNNTECEVTGIADVKYTNGADNYLVSNLLDVTNIDWLRTNYSAWNTAGNTLGTVCAFSIVQLLGQKELLDLDVAELKKLQAIFFLEHWAFQSNVREKLVELAKEKGVQPWTVMGVELWAEKYVSAELKKYSVAVEESLKVEFEIDEVFFPWHRSFEIGLSLTFK